MVIDPQTYMEAQRRAISYLSQPTKTVVRDGNKSEMPNEFFVPGNQITAPVTLIQELAFVNTEKTYTFNFASTAPGPSAILNNVNLPKNNVAAVFALQFLIGKGDAANNREYFSHGFSTNDNSVYNSNVQMLIEDQTKINLTTGHEFKDVLNSPLEVNSLSGVQIINPIRILSGEMGTWQVVLSLNNPITLLKLTSALFLSCRLKVVMGQASGQPKK